MGSGYESFFERPSRRPKRCHFSSGPTAKRPGWSPACLEDAFLGRSHRASGGRGKIEHCLSLMRELLLLPEDYRIAIVPGSDTGAVEMAMWSLLGVRGVDVLAWEAFGAAWAADATGQLPLEDVRVLEAPYGSIVDFDAVDDARDVVLAWNGTASGVCVPHSDWIKPEREGLIIADSTSAAFAMRLPVEKLDVITFSWQKSLGGEAAHGVIVLSPKAVERLETYTPPWPVPKVFRLAKDGVLDEGLFKGATLNTPSMLCIEDAIDALLWAKELAGGGGAGGGTRGAGGGGAGGGTGSGAGGGGAGGGAEALFARVEANFGVIKTWVEGHPSLAFLAADPATRSKTSMTLKITAEWFRAAGAKEQSRLALRLVGLLEDEGVAYDIGSYRAAPPGLRLWGGPTVEAEDLRVLTEWIDWGLREVEHKERTA